MLAEIKHRKSQVITDHTQNNRNAIPKKWTGQTCCLIPSRNGCPGCIPRRMSRTRPTSQWTWYATEGSPVDEDGYYDTDKEKVDYLFFGYVVGFEPELGYFSLNDLKTAKEGLRDFRALPIERDVWFTPKPLSEIRREHDDV